MTEDAAKARMQCVWKYTREILVVTLISVAGIMYNQMYLFQLMPQLAALASALLATFLVLLWFTVYAFWRLAKAKCEAENGARSE